MTVQKQEQVKGQGELDAATRTVEAYFLSRRTRETRKTYRAILKAVLRNSGSDAEIGTFLVRCKQETSIVEQEIEQWVNQYRTGHSSYSVVVMISVLKSLLKYAEKPFLGSTFEFDFENIKAAMPRVSRKKSKRRATSLENIQRVFRIASLRGKFMITLFASSGVRLGATDYFRVKDLQEIKLSFYYPLQYLVRIPSPTKGRD